MPETIELAVACNDRYIYGLAVLLQSITEHLEPEYRLRVHVMQSSLNDENKAKLEQLAEERGVVIEWHAVDEEWLEQQGISESLVQMTPKLRFRHVELYYRLLLPTLLPDDIKRVIYIDCDIMALRSIAPLWHEPFEGSAALAVQEKPWPAIIAPLHLPGLRNDEQHPYFNSGVMVFNLPAWREQRLSQQAIGLLQELMPKTSFPDQDILNMLLINRWRAIASDWNHCAHYPDTPLAHEVALIHFSFYKPWQYEYHSPHYPAWFKQEFFDHLENTPWAGFRPTKPRFHKVFEFCQKHRIILHVTYNEFLQLTVARALRPYMWHKTVQSIRAKRVRGSNNPSFNL